MLPELAAALDGQDESLAFNRRLDHEQRLADLDADRLAAMDAQGIDVSVIALTQPGTQVLGDNEAVRLSRAGAMVHGHAGGLTLDDPIYDDLWATATRLRQPVFLHPQLPSDAVRAATYRGFDATTDLALTTFGWG